MNTYTPIPYVEDDGGRATSARQKKSKRTAAGDCVTRAIAIATGIDYDLLWNRFADEIKKLGRRRTADNGVSSAIANDYMRGLGWQVKKPNAVHTVASVAEHFPCCVMTISTGKGRYHMLAVINGELRDTFDSQMRRCEFTFINSKLHYYCESRSDWIRASAGPATGKPHTVTQVLVPPADYTPPDRSPSPVPVSKPVSAQEAADNAIAMCRKNGLDERHAWMFVYS